jgi:3-(3-hydroxy-phenyl)propionate hydroxylase
VGARERSNYEVVVVGFGPSGATATALLGQHGIRTLAVDRLRTVYDKPRAIAIDHEILRLFDNLGVAERILPHVAPFPASQHFGADGQLIRRIDIVPAPYPLGYTPTMVFSQPPVEEALREHARAYPGIEVSLGTELVGLEQFGERVTLDLRRDDGEARTVTADYVIACDGASSTVRQGLGIAFDDLVFDEPWLVVDVMVHDHALGKLPETAAQFCDPARPTTFIIGPGNHRRWEIMLLPGEDPRAMEHPGKVWELLSRWITPADATLWRAASYRFHALVAAEWRRGRVFLAGDAAHQQPPFIGQGMCQGLRDVSNLVWKLVRVLKAESDDALLDTYAEERAAHVRELTTRIKAIGQVICERNPEAARVRDARILGEGGGKPRTITRQEIVPSLTTGLLSERPHPASGTLFPQPWIAAGGSRRLLDAVVGAGWRLIIDGRGDFAVSDDARQRSDELGVRIVRVRPPAEHERAAEDADGARDVGVTETEGVVARWFDTHHCQAALVRPDHYVFGVADDERALAGLMTELKHRLYTQGTGEPRRAPAPADVAYFGS